MILNHRVGLDISFYDTLHGLQTGHGKRNASLKANLLNIIMYIREEFLYEISLYLPKIYYALDRYRCV